MKVCNYKTLRFSFIHSLIIVPQHSKMIGSGKAYISIFILCMICFGDSLNGKFVFDDTVAIVKNKDIISKTSITELLSHDFWGTNLSSPHSHKSYRPLTTLMFRFEYQYLNFRSYGMKIVNLFIHFLNSCLVFYIFKDIKPKVAFHGAIVFVIHPVHTEAVCGIVGRADLMFCMCFLIVLILNKNLKGSFFKGEFLC